MSGLLDFGIADTHDHPSLLPPTAQAAEEFFTAAESTLRTIAPRILSMINADSLHRGGRWHPTGYMVLTLGRHGSLGVLRLHVWPNGHRSRESRAPGIQDVHDHVVRISSMVICGTYRDTIYTVTPAELDDGSGSVLHVYMPPQERSGSEALVPSGEWLRVEPKIGRTVAEGDMHSLDIGVFHAPRVPNGELVATLSFSSFPARLGMPKILVPGTPRVIFGKTKRTSDADVSEALRGLRCSNYFSL